MIHQIAEEEEEHCTPEALLRAWGVHQGRNMGHCENGAGFGAGKLRGRDGGRNGSNGQRTWKGLVDRKNHPNCSKEGTQGPCKKPAVLSTILEFPCFSAFYPLKLKWNQVFLVSFKGS